MSEEFTPGWKLSPRELVQAAHMGMGKEEIEALEEKRREKYEAMKARALEASDISEDELETYFDDRYGFHHTCHCFDDQFAGNMVTTTRCEIEVKAKALDYLETVNLERDTLAEAVEDLRRQVTELGEEPVA